MNKNYEEPALYISMFDDEDDIVTMSTMSITNSSYSAEEQANSVFSDGFSVYSVDVNEKN